MNHDGSIWTQIIAWLFVVSNTGRLLAYLPQIVATARCRQGARGTSLLTWGYFALAHLSAMLYAVFVLQDDRAAWIFAGNFAVTVILVAVILWKRHRHGRESRRREPAAELSAACERKA
jgi:predicted lysophospholipase L1 biosynthesis ABC-type transport system permease subunit